MAMEARMSIGHAAIIMCYSKHVHQKLACLSLLCVFGLQALEDPVLSHIKQDTVVPRRRRPHLAALGILPICPSSLHVPILEPVMHANLQTDADDMNVVSSPRANMHKTGPKIGKSESISMRAAGPQHQHA